MAVPDDTPLGDAADDTRTSTAVMAILQACADAYTSAPVFFGEGRYLVSQKIGEKSLSESYSLTINFRRPDKLRVEISGKTDETLFLADGTTVTMNWPKAKEYKQMSQPEDLAAFVEEERAGVLLHDDTQSVIRSTAPALLVSEDALAWIHANVEKYIFEGSETVSGADTWRIKFVQSKGSTIITIWVDKGTGFLRKNSTMIATDEAGYYVDSYTDAYRGAIIIAIFDRISTRVSNVPKSRFRLGRIPQNWTNISKEDDAATEDSADGTSLFSKFFRAAAEETATTPTATLEGDSEPGSLLQVLWKLDLPQRASAVAWKDSNPRTVHILAQNKPVYVLDRNGHEERRYRIAQSASKAALSADGKMLFTISKNKRALQAHDSRNGSFLWANSLQGTLETLLPLPTKNEVMIGGDKGVFVVSADGELLFFSRRVTEVTQLIPDPAVEGNIIVFSDDDGIILYSGEGRWLEELSTNAAFTRIAGFMENSERTYFALNQGEAGDVALQHLDSKGRPLWTVGVAAPAKDLAASAVMTANLRLRDDDSATTGSTGVVITQMNDGRLSVFSQEGKPIWRGRIATNDPLFMASPQDGVIASYATDLNGDGSDELIVVLPRSVLALTASQ